MGNSLALHSGRFKSRIPNQYYKPKPMTTGSGAPTTCIGHQLRYTIFRKNSYRGGGPGGRPSTNKSLSIYISQFFRSKSLRVFRIRLHNFKLKSPYETNIPIAQQINQNTTMPQVTQTWSQASSSINPRTKRRIIINHEKLHCSLPTHIQTD